MDNKSNQYRKERDVLDQLNNYVYTNVVPKMEKQGFFFRVEKNEYQWIKTTMESTHKLVLNLIRKPGNTNLSESDSQLFLKAHYAIHYHFKAEDALETDINKFHKQASIPDSDTDQYWALPAAPDQLGKELNKIFTQIYRTILPWYEEVSDLQKVYQETQSYINAQKEAGSNYVDLYNEYYLASRLAKKLGLAAEFQELKSITNKIKQTPNSGFYS